MKRSKDIFLDLQEYEAYMSDYEAEKREKEGDAGMEGRTSNNWIEPIHYPWNDEKTEPAKDLPKWVQEQKDDPVAEHDDKEHRIAINKKIERDD